MNKHELITYIQSVINKKYGGLQAAFAQDNEMSAAYVNDVLKGRREPGQKILNAVGVEKVVTYRVVDGV